MRRGLLFGVGAALVAMTILVGACGDPERAPVASRVEAPAPSTTTTSTTEAPPAEAAQAVVGEVRVYDAPGAATPVRAMRNPTWEHQPLVMLVKQHAGEWLQVQVPERPNETTVWVKASDVDVFAVPTRVVVELGVYRGDEVADEEAVAVGRPTTPTPVGNFYVDAIVKDPGPPYGPWQLSIAGFSDVLRHFGGGNGQIAMHGWHDPSVVGHSVSNGCIRMANDAVSRVAALVGLGTPVSIVA
jgi:lipoprotein-anchoring transpeptidase ErfK/SrfK